MWWRRKRNPYLKPGRRGDVIAAIQTMSAGERSEASVGYWALMLSREETPELTQRWRSVFREHSEFFVLYTLKGNEKAALRLRYAFRVVDPATGKTLSRQEINKLGDEKWNLTSDPLATPATEMLIWAATDLHSRAVQEATDWRFWLTLIMPFLGALVGAILGLVGALAAHGSTVVGTLPPPQL